MVNNLRIDGFSSFIFEESEILNSFYLNLVLSFGYPYYFRSSHLFQICGCLILMFTILIKKLDLPIHPGSQIHEGCISLPREGSKSLSEL